MGVGMLGATLGVGWRGGLIGIECLVGIAEGRPEGDILIGGISPCYVGMD